MSRSLHRTLAVLLAWAPLCADTIVVDAAGGPGADFTEIGPAVSAAADGDLLLVRPGTYRGFFVSGKGLTIQGEAGVELEGSLTVFDLQASQTFRMVDLDLAEIWFDGCEGTIVLDEVVVDLACCSAPLLVTGCRDVRLHRCQVVGFALAINDVAEALFVRDSRVEIVASELLGEPGEDPSGSSSPGGAVGVEVESSRVHLAESSVTGGAGASSTSCTYGPGWGGAGVRTFVGPSTVVIAGPGAVIAGGAGGAGPAGQCDGMGGSGARLVADSGFLRYTGASVAGGAHPGGGNAPAIDADPQSTVEAPVELDPTLTRLDTPRAGMPVRVRIQGEPFSSVRLEIGRRTEIVPEMGSFIERLIVPQRGLDLGTLPANGERTVTLTLPAGAPTGAAWWLQASTLLSGNFQRSNSLPLIVR